MRGLKTPRAVRWLSVIVLAAACDDTLTPNVLPACFTSFDIIVEGVPPGRPFEVPVGGSRQLRVWLAPAQVRHRLESQGCPSVSLDGFRWTNEDPSVARLEQHGEGVATITGLAVGETEIVVQYGVHTELRLWMTVEVVASEDNANRENRTQSLKLTVTNDFGERPSVTWEIPVNTGCGEATCVG